MDKGSTHCYTYKDKPVVSPAVPGAVPIQTYSCNANWINFSQAQQQVATGNSKPITPKQPAAVQPAAKDVFLWMLHVHPTNFNHHATNTTHAPLAPSPVQLRPGRVEVKVPAQERHTLHSKNGLAGWQPLTHCCSAQVKHCSVLHHSVHGQ